MSAPTKNDWNSFHVESFDNKVNVLFYYLCQSGYNMQEIAQNVLHDYNPHGAQRVSLITRCYGFEGRNGGTFRNIGATREDVVAFVKAYPNGCNYDGNGQIMKAFLLKRVQSRIVPQRTATPVTRTTATPRTTAAPKNPPMTGMDYIRNSPYGWEKVSDGEVTPATMWERASNTANTQTNCQNVEEDENLPYDGIGSKAWNIFWVIIGIAFFCICKFVLDWNWIVSIIVAFVGVEIISGIIFKKI